MDAEPARASHLDQVRRGLAAAVVVVAAVVLVGWQFGWLSLTRQLPGSVEMKPNTALVLGALAAAVGTEHRRLRIGVGCAVAALTGVTLFEFASGWSVGVDLLIPWLDLHGESGRMAEATAIALFALALALLGSADGRTWVVTAASLTAWGLGYLALLGYLYGASELYDVIGYTNMAAPTAATICLLAGASLLLEPDAGAMGLFTDHGSAGRMLRRMIPFFVFVSPALGGARLWGQRRGWFDTEFGVAILIAVMVASGIVVTWWAGLRIAAADRARDDARAELVALNADLARQVEIRGAQANRAVARFGALMESAPDAMLGVGRDGTILLVNAEAEKIFGFDRDDLVGRPVEVLLPAALGGRHVNHRKRYLEKPSRRPMGAGKELAARRKDGSEFPAEVSLSTIQTEDGPLVIAAVRDASERRAFEAELQAARAVAEGAARSRQEFLATMSHEIRTPMNAVIGMTSLLLDSSLDAQQRDYLETIRTSGDHLLSLINDVLDYAKIDAGRLELEAVPFDVREWLHSTVELIASSAHDKGLELVYDVDPDVPVGLIGDPARLRQVLVNLLSNSVKFTEYGEVEVDIGVEPGAPGPDGAVGLWMSVRDTGIGIDSAQMDGLFEPFTQADSSTTRVYGGTGLGLAIARRLARAMGGDLVLTSTAGEGTTAIMRWQAQRGTPRGSGSAGVVTDEALTGVRLLVVDDNAPNRRILRAWAERHGMVCEAVEGAEQALSLLENGARFAVAVLDLMMPGIDGIELSRMLRAREPLMHQILLSSAGPYTADLVHGERFDAVLTKPARPDRLFGKIAGLLDDVGTPDSEPEQPVSPGSPPPMRILVVEDVLVNQKVARHLLARFGYDCDVASGGEEAITALDEKDYQLVLMDVQMPGVDGLEATRRIRARWPERPLRIVALTANVGAEDIRACHDAGMDGFLGKPITLESLGAVLDDTASASQTFVTRGPSSAASETLPPPGPRLADLVDPQVLDELFAMFAEGLDSTMEEIEAGCRAENCDVVARAAHRLLGSARSLGIDRLGALCQRLEAYAEGGDWPRTRGLLPRMRGWQELVRERGPDLLR